MQKHLPTEFLHQFIDSLSRSVRRVQIEPGLTQTEFDRIEERFRISFPPDLRDLLSYALPVGGHFPDWRNGAEDKLRTMLDWPADGICWDVEHNNFWYEGWGERPARLEDAIEVVLGYIAGAPTLIPIYSHRYIPDRPAEPGNPVFSVYGTDIIYYGEDLADYFAREFRVVKPERAATEARWVEFWTDFIDDIWSPERDRVHTGRWWNPQGYINEHGHEPG